MDDPIYRFPRLDHVEEIEDYCEDGLHPVLIGDTFSEKRYRVLLKLGHGGFSTVWLARDEVLERNVALKIIGASASSEQSDVQILEFLQQNSSSNTFCDKITRVLDNFTFEGPNGVHNCVVLPVGGPTIKEISFGSEIVEGARRLNARIARKLARQVVEAVAFMHSKGVVHGDLTTSNILVQLKDIDTWTVEEIYQRLGEPKKETVYTRSGDVPDSRAPAYLVETAAVHNISFDWLNENIMVIDFGEAFYIDNPPSDGLGTPMGFRAPELIFDMKASVWSDIWAMGCCIFSFRAGFCIFSPFFPDDSDEVLQYMTRTLGKLPERWWRQRVDRATYFDDDGQEIEQEHNSQESKYLLRNEIANIGSRDDVEDRSIQAGTPEISEFLEVRGTRPSDEEVNSMEDLLLKMLKYSPEERTSAKDLAEHPWFDS